MSSRLAGGRRVSMAPNRIRRPKRDPGGLADTEEEASSGRLKNAIFNDEIARLRIREEDLVKVSREARAGAAAPDDPMTTTYTRVAVRKTIPEAERCPPLRRVVLLRRAQPDVPTPPPLLAACDPTADLARCPSEGHRRPGPRLDHRGNVVPHSLLGRPEEFYRIGLSRGHLRPEEVPLAYRSAEWARLYCEEAPTLRDADEEGERMARDSSRPEAQADDSAGSVEYRWMPDRLLDLPAVVSGDSWTSRPGSPSATTSARAHNRAVFIGSGLPVRRLTEQLNQCLPDEAPDRELLRLGLQQASQFVIPIGSTGRAAVLLHRRLELSKDDATRMKLKLDIPTAACTGEWGPVHSAERRLNSVDT